MKKITITCARVFILILLLSCVNTSYSRWDERHIDDDLIHLILGQFPHHSLAFYEYEEVKNQKILEKKPMAFEVRNDLAVAYLKQEKWDLAIQEFKKNEELHSGKYKTAANLGVMYKKMGKYKLAAEYIQKSLQIQPEGHMGLGDYYLKMIQWLQAPSKENNFLGISYEASPKENAEAANRQHLITLIKNDYQFPEAYLILGDILYTEKNYQLAMRAYFRAYSMSRDSLVYLKKFEKSMNIAFQRLQDINIHLHKQKSALSVVDYNGAINQFEKEVTSAEAWLKSFQNTENKLIEAGIFPTFDVTLKKMDALNISRPPVIEAMSYAGFQYDMTFILMALVVILPLLALAFLRPYLRRSKKVHK